MNNIDLKQFFKDHWLILAPMAGVNDPVFRQLCLGNGAMLTYTEMVSSKALSYKNPKTKNLLQLAPNEDKVVVQLFGHEPNVMANEACKLESEMGERLAYIDINMGCPAKKIIKKGDGAALMSTPKLASEIVSACTSLCSVPISVKFRKGFKLGENLAESFAEKMTKAGASALCVHGRYAMQFYKGEADFNVAKDIKKSVDIPLIWSGDTTDFSSAKNLLNKINVDAVMIGRAARGNPWVFRDDEKPSFSEIISTAKRHVVEYAKLNPLGLSHMRKHCMWYTSGMPGATIARNRFSSCKNVDDYLYVFDDLLKKVEEHES